MAYQPPASQRHPNGSLSADAAEEGADQHSDGDEGTPGDSGAPSKRPSTYHNLKTAAVRLHVRLPRFDIVVSHY